MKPFIAILFLFFSTFLWSKEIPVLSSPVMDEVGLLRPNVRNYISQTLRQYYKDNGIQLEVYIINSLEGEPLESFSMEVAEKWKLGDAELDKGVLLLVSILDRKIRIEVGQGLEGDLPDITAGRIIDSMAPYFRSGDYQGGIAFAIREISTQVGPTINFNGTRVISKRSKGTHGTGLIFTIFILISFFGRMFFPLILFSGGRFGGYGHRHRYSTGGHGGFSSGSSGWSGGGGGFSGGGASGSW